MLTKQKTTNWKGLDVVPPVWGRQDVPGFGKWVNYNGFEKGVDGVFKKTKAGFYHRDGHDGFDFAAYIDKTGKCILGLPGKTPVRAIADGMVRRVDGQEGGYDSRVVIDHNHDRQLLGRGPVESYYFHVMPLIEEGKLVKRGDIIALLYKAEGNDQGPLVHLHLSIMDAREAGAYRPIDRMVDPIEAFPMLNKLVASPQAWAAETSTEFTINGLKQQPEIVVANFKRLLE